MIKQIKRMLNITKYDKADSDDIFRMLLPSFIGIIACAVCIVGLTMAWFTSSVKTPSVQLGASRFVMDTTVVGGTDEEYESEIISDSGIYELKAKGTYSVTVTGISDIGSGSGYAIISYEYAGTEYSYVTDPITFKDGHYTSVTFTIKVPEDLSVRIEGGWGTSSTEASIKNGGIYDFAEPVIESTAQDSF